MLNEEKRKAEFPGLLDRTYLNTAAEGVPPLRLREALDTYQRDKALGMDGREFHFRELDTCRENASRILGLEDRDEVAIVSSASEAFNLLASSIQFGIKGEVVVTDLEFPSGVSPWLLHPDKPLVQVWKNRGGVLDLNDLRELLSDNTRLVQISLVSFLTGYRVPWEPFHDLVRERAPEAILSVDVTQAAGRIPLPCQNADCLIASGYKWLLGSHGCALVAVPSPSTDRIRVRAGGWHHLLNAFDADRFERAAPPTGAAGFAVGMPSFPAVYSLRAGIDFLLEEGVGDIAKQTDPLVQRLHMGLQALGIQTLAPLQEENCSGIVAFHHKDDAALHSFLSREKIQVMFQAGRIRLSVHGYNTTRDIEQCLSAIHQFVH
ncbi:MAG: aminotransferase class V-fold PLP-dependent enzyme [Verrucomicrobiota bacterium]